VKDRAVTGDNVRTVLAWVARGEADAGVVYGTDAKVEPRVKVAFTFPQSSYPAILYPMAIVKGASHAKDAAEFLAFCQSAAGMAVFRDAGFSVAPTAK
jgi:molybdate transport system substrate-binding protein